MTPARACVLAAIAVAAGLAACSPVLTAQSAAPPGRQARLDEVRGFWGLKSYRIELSQGVALAMSCYRGGPCEKLVVTSDNPAVAEVRPASLGTLERSGFANQATTSAVVVIGKQPGVTRLRVRAKEGDRDVTVTVVAPPSHSPAAAVAR